MTQTSPRFLSRPAPVPLFSFLLAGSLLALPTLAGTVRTLEAEADLDHGGTLVLEIPVAEITVDGVAGNQVRLELEISCESSSCREKAEKLELVHRGGVDRQIFEIDGYPSMGSSPDLELRIRMPRDRHLELELGVGELSIEGLEGDLDLEVGVGDVELVLVEKALRSVEVEVGVGDADLDLPGSKEAESSGFLFLGNSLSWDDGPGTARVQLEVGVGDANVEVR